MPHVHTEAPSTRRLLQATAVAIAAAGVILSATVLPAEYGIDPTGLGARLGLDALTRTAQSAQIEVPAWTSRGPVPGGADDAAEAAKAAAAFGAAPGQAFDAEAVLRTPHAFRRDTFTLALAPGKGAEVKASLGSGQGMVFHWSATGDVAVDMHGERHGAKGEWTTYWVEPAQREGSGTFVAPFDGSHGWYWQNRGTRPVTVQLEVAGFHGSLYRPGHP